MKIKKPPVYGGIGGIRLVAEAGVAPAVPGYEPSELLLLHPAVKIINAISLAFKATVPRESYPSPPVEYLSNAAQKMPPSAKPSRTPSP